MSRARKRVAIGGARPPSHQTYRVVRGECGDTADVGKQDYSPDAAAEIAPQRPRGGPTAPATSPADAA
ncbi:hypothetical protein [Methylobacterium sp. WSM2598]|uniref:hypothetical protein n=1 Tax=Methylobacterium sp. WSM2598 TaxID=398261 RepID=UPI000375859F|nr:hypothetical protein [Methylobacterium sp. WSM2598]